MSARSWITLTDLRPVGPTVASPRPPAPAPWRLVIDMTRATGPAVDVYGPDTTLYGTIRTQHAPVLLRHLAHQARAEAERSSSDRGWVTHASATRALWGKSGSTESLHVALHRVRLSLRGLELEGAIESRAGWLRLAPHITTEVVELLTGDGPPLTLSTLRAHATDAARDGALVEVDGRALLALLRRLPPECGA